MLAEWASLFPFTHQIIVRIINQASKRCQERLGSAGYFRKAIQDVKRAGNHSDLFPCPRKCHRICLESPTFAYGWSSWKLADAPGKAGTPGQTRTGDTRIKNPLIYFRLDFSPCATGVTKNADNCWNLGIRIERRIKSKSLIILIF